jgi:hypothetical protein
MFIPSCGTVHMVLFISPSSLFTWHCSSTADSLPRAITMPDDTKAAALRARLEAIVKEAEDVEAQATAARRRVQAARLLLEESKATALKQTGTVACQRVPSSSSSSSSLVVASQLVPTASSTYDTVVAGLYLQAATVLNVR